MPKISDIESWLKSAARQPSDTEDEKRNRTERQIRDALSDYSPLHGRPWRVYVKGSYANNTNVRLNFDVDIAVEYHGYFYYDLDFELKGQPKAAAGIVDSNDSYTRDDFKADVKAAMVRAFGNSAVEQGRIALRIRENATTLPADVVPCWEYRRYDRLDANGNPVFRVGSRVYPSNGRHVDNFPHDQLQNGIQKNRRTLRRYKRMVRCLKKLQTRLVEEGLLKQELPSYLTECLVYNVTDSAFGHATYEADMRAVLAQIFNATLVGGEASEWHDVHELKYLFRAGRGWTIDDVHQMASAAWDFLNFE